MTEGYRQNKTSDECARFKVPDSGCPWHNDLGNGIMESREEAEP